MLYQKDKNDFYEEKQMKIYLFYSINFLTLFFNYESNDPQICLTLLRYKIKILGLHDITFFLYYTVNNKIKVQLFRVNCISCCKFKIVILFIPAG